RTCHQPPAMRTSRMATPIIHANTIADSSRSTDNRDARPAATVVMPFALDAAAIDRGCAASAVFVPAGARSGGIENCETVDAVEAGAVQIRRAVRAGAASIATRPTHAMRYRALADRSRNRRSAVAITRAIAAPCQTK